MRATIPSFTETSMAQWAEVSGPFFLRVVLWEAEKVSQALAMRRTKRLTKRVTKRPGFSVFKIFSGQDQSGHTKGSNRVTMSWQQALERTVTGMGYDVVDVERSAGGLLRVTIDRLPSQAYSTGPGELVLVEDCEIVTRQLQYLLEVEAVDYARLEVSSPGLDRPIRKAADWQRFVGEEVEVHLRRAFQNRKRWRGVLTAGADAQQWRLLLPPEVAVNLGKGGRPVRPAVQARAIAKATAKARVVVDPETQQVLDFSLDEVREARLVPVVDFKGRRGAAPADAGPDAATQAHKEDGGQD